AGGTVNLDVNAFLMDFDNLVVAQTVEGLPALANAGSERFKGVEADLAWRIRNGWTLRAAYSYHDARFRDYVAEFDGVPTQLADKRLEMSPHSLGAFGLLYAPAHGVFGSVDVNLVGGRFLNKRNTALADSYVSVAASLGYRSGRWEVRGSGRNLGDTRPAVS